MVDDRLLRQIASAYPRRRRVRDAIRHLRRMSGLGSQAFENTKSKEIARSYRIEVRLVRKIKAKFRNELSFNEGGK
jgi:hypothetical protein